MFKNKQTNIILDCHISDNNIITLLSNKEIPNIYILHTVYSQIWMSSLINTSTINRNHHDHYHMLCVLFITFILSCAICSYKSIFEHTMMNWDTKATLLVEHLLLSIYPFFLTSSILLCVFLLSLHIYLYIFF